MVDATDLKSVSHIESEGSSPSTPIIHKSLRCRNLNHSLLHSKQISTHLVLKIAQKARSHLTIIPNFINSFFIYLLCQAGK